MARKSNAQMRAEAEAEAAARAEAIAKGVEERIQSLIPSIVAAAVTQIGNLRGAEGSPVSASAESHDALAHAIARAADPANTRNIIAPEELKKRESARIEMLDMLATYHEAYRAGDENAMPVYKVIRKVVFAETLIEPQYHDPVSKQMVDQEVNWPSIPNQALLPVNEAAQQIHSAFLRSIGEQPLDISKEAAPWVLSANKIMRGRAGTERPEVQEAGPIDVRRSLPGMKQTRQAVLGTLAAPAVIGA